LDGSSGNTATATGDGVTDVSPSPLAGAAEPLGAATGTDLLSDGAAAAAAITPATIPDAFSNYAMSISGLQLISLGTPVRNRVSATSRLPTGCTRTPTR
jgi:hypothetical protein